MNASNLANLKKTIKKTINKMPSFLSNRIEDFILKNSGKLIRPIIIVETARLLGANEKQLEQSFLIGTIIELFHNAALIHDDILDRAPLRRGQAAYYKFYGRDRALSDGDTLFFFAFMQSKSLSKEIMIHLLETVYTVGWGNARELEIRLDRKFDFSREDIIEIMNLKTATLFHFCINSACILTNHKNLGEKLKSCLLNAGIGFQIQDDILDIISNEQIFGKKNSWDIQESKPNLFLYYALKTKQASRIKEIYSKQIGKKTKKDVEFVLKIFRRISPKIIAEKNYFISKATNETKQILKSIDISEKASLENLKNIIDLLGNRKK